MQPTTREMQAMAAAGQISLDDLRAAAGSAGGGVHDDFLDQMLGLGGLPPSAWPELASAASGAKAPEGGAQTEGMQQQHQQFGGGLYDESALLVSRLRQHQISGGGLGGAESAAAAKQMVLQQLADVRQGHHHMLLQGMGRSTGGGGDGGLLLPLSLGSGGSGGDVQALLKAAANSAVLIHRLLLPSNPLAAFFSPAKNLESFCKKFRVFIRCVRSREEKPAASLAAPSPDRYSSSNINISSSIHRFAMSKKKKTQAYIACFI
jgi:hypothetical protein